MTKYIFITGGVLSGVGKGVTSSSVGALLKARGYSIFVQKLDPYLNHDPGTMSPLQHGEVFVTEDGSETDLDLGHYERFIGTAFNKDSNYTSGTIYSEIFKLERKGEYHGKTVQVIPHVTDLITKKIKNISSKYKPDFVIVETGGTVGDIELQPYIYAISNFVKKNAFYIHTTYVPFLSASCEHKTKPTQHSIQLLRSYGITPNAIVLRSNKEIDKSQIKKISNYSFLGLNEVLNLPNVKNIYQIPLIIEKFNLIKVIENHFNISNRRPDLNKWNKINKLIVKPNKKTIKIGMVGKYTELHDAYLSIIESLKIASIYQSLNVELKWMDSSKINASNCQDIFDSVDGIIILPGFGVRGLSGKLEVAKFARKNRKPILGICLGMQVMIIVQAMFQGIKDATSSEFSKTGTYVVDIIRGKKQTDNIGGTLRLGNWECQIKPGTLAYSIYKKKTMYFRHRHRYEINPKYLSKIKSKDFIFSGINPKNNLVEIIEYKKHPFYFGVQFHPEFSTTAVNSNPLFDAFLKVAVKV